MAKYEYKVALYKENIPGVQFPGNSKIDPNKFEKFLNCEGNDGWEVVSIEKGTHGVPSFFQREDVLVVMKRIKNENLKRCSK